MNFGLKTYLAEETKRFNVVLVKKKLYLNEWDNGNKQEWSLTPRGKPLVTFWPGDVLVGLKSEHSRLKWVSVMTKEGHVRHSDAVAGNTVSGAADFKPSEYDEMIKLGALKGLA